jgi:hypothetical protein
MTDVDVDRSAVTALTAAVASAGNDFDGVAATAPGAVDAGLASDVVTGILATFSGCGARLVTATGSLASTADACNAAYGSADAAAAERFLVAGGAPSAP